MWLIHFLPLYFLYVLLICREDILDLYKLGFQWYSPLAVGIVILLGLIISCITGNYFIYSSSILTLYTRRLQFFCTVIVFSDAVAALTFWVQRRSPFLSKRTTSKVFPFPSKDVAFQDAFPSDLRTLVFSLQMIIK